MDNDKLYNLSEIFTSRIFRIPDYQRGYAWDEEQLIDFWEDLIYCIKLKKKYHYTGLISIEPVKEKLYTDWYNDKWLINRGYKPFFIVDGQQRITTCIIFIQCIIEIAEKEDIMSLKEGVIVDWIKNNYIKQDNDTLVSYLFGYYKDNISDNWLKNKILQNNLDFLDESSYTKNLSSAKEFFNGKITKKIKERKDKRKSLLELFEVLTTKLVFNLYTINEESDVYMAFETMNNRGKTLSTLELLKNRLIYLSTLLNGEETDVTLNLINKINDCWKNIYNYLGKNPDKDLYDDDFLYNHWIMYFTFSRKVGKMYKKYLLDFRFSPYRLIEGDYIKSIMKERDNENIFIKTDELTFDEINIDEDIDMEKIIKDENKALDSSEIIEYLKSLKVSIEQWFFIHYPTHNDCHYSNEEKKWLERLNRLGFGFFEPLILASFLNNEISSLDRAELLKQIERFNFILYKISFIRANTGDSTFYAYARRLYGKTLRNKEEKIDLPFLINEIKNFVDKNIDAEKFRKFILDRFIKQKDGFYGWGGLKYFLYEYELNKIEKGEHSQKHIEWDKFTIQREKSSIEHIYPQTPNNDDWPEFKDFNSDGKLIIQNSLGNLLPLKLTKNIKQQNHSFKEKVNGEKNGVKIEGLTGYREGSYSEQEVVSVALDYVWDINKIEKRGLLLLKFLNERWITKFWEEEKEQKEILGLNLLNDFKIE